MANHLGFDSTMRLLLQSRARDPADRQERPMAEEPATATSATTTSATTTSATDITAAAHQRNTQLIARCREPLIELEPRYLVQMAHLTTPATVWKYVEGAATRSIANLVMLDLEDSIPRDNPELLERGRANVIRAFNELDWGRRLRFFRPRGT